MSKRALVMCLASSLFAIGAAAQPPERAGVVNPQRIVAALAANGINITPGQLDVLGEVRTLHANPALEITAIVPWQQASAKVRLRCQQREECLPFYVLVNWASEPDSEAAIGA
ncbi:MAG TPA: hypothetical protein VE779_17325, partial [Candidatus Angelobacter sp.]|nr:hypothetical protein [Candidatus Angelobacter sp.]